MSKTALLQFKRGKKPWKEVFCSLVGSTLTITKSSDINKCVDHIDLHLVSSIDKTDDPKKKFTFIIEGSNVDVFSAESEADRDDWVELLRKAMTGGSVISMNDFEVLSIIGRGAYAKVQLVRHKTDKKIYAMKSISKAKIVKDNLIDKTFLERNLMLSVENRFIVSAHYSFQTETKLIIVSDYVPGGELKSRIKADQHFSVPRVRMYAAQLIEGIGYLHENGVLHRDLKPENVLIDVDGSLKITDFGFAKVGMDEGDQTQSFCGTPYYIAPEMIMREPYSKSVDWWSLGVMIYEMTFGMPPFFNENVNLTYNSIVNDSPLFPNETDLQFYPGVDENIIDLINQLLEKNPENRLGSGPGDYHDVESHPFFNGFDFEALRRGELENEWKPTIENKLDVSQFSSEFTNLTPQFSFDAPEVIDASAQQQFQGFTWKDEF